MTLRVLMLSSRPPDPNGLGGVEIHVAALCGSLPPDCSVSLAYPHAGALRVEGAGPRKLVAVLPLAGSGAPLGANPALADALAAALVGLQADVLHVHSANLGPRAIADAAARTAVRVAVTLHDHSFVCENYELLEAGVRYCGIPDDLRRCDRCLGNVLGRTAGAVQEWRSAVRHLVSTADAFVVPSQSVLDHAARVHPEIRDRVHRIPWGVPEPSARSAIRAAEGPLRVAVVGLLKTVKGRGRLAALLSAARTLDVEWHFFGATEGDSLRDVRRAARRVVVHGSYPRHALGSRLVAAGCHAALLPSIGPEAFSLTLSEIVAAGVPVIATELGSLGERVSGEGLGWTFDPWDEAGFLDLLASLERNRERIDRVASHVRSLERRTEERMTSDYVALWTSLAARPRRPELTDEVAARASFEAGRALAAAYRPSRIASAVDSVRRTDFYRDLPLRRAVPLSVRKRLEHLVSRLGSRTGWK